MIMINTTQFVLDGAGNSPPEDVGGQDGYDSFLEIIADENHPNMRIWSAGVGHRAMSFDLERVNRFLSSRLDTRFG